MIDIDKQDKMIEYYIRNYKSESQLIKKIKNEILELDSNILVSILENCDLNKKTKRLFGI